jgi:hypothetical protein
VGVIIKDKLYLYTGVILLLSTMAVNFPFPHEHPLGEGILSIMNFPVRTAQGLHVVGIIGVTLLIIGLYLVVNSFRIYRGRVFVLAVLMVLFAPAMLANALQQTVASGIYAIDYKSYDSKCEFELTDATLHGECELPFKNYSGDNVDFEVEFYEEELFSEMVSLMNSDAPYKVSLGPYEDTSVKFEVNINVTNKKDYISSGTASHVKIIIKSGDRIRKL